MITLRYKFNKHTLHQLPLYPQLVSVIQKQFSLPPNSFNITYIDQDNDHISVTNQDDITAMVQTVSFIELYIHDKEELCETIIDDNLLNLSNQIRNAQQEQCVQSERVKKNVEEYFDKMEKVWGDFRIKEEQNANNMMTNDFLNATIELVESKQINLSKQLDEPTSDLSQQKDIQKLIEEKITQSIPQIISMVRKSLEEDNLSTSSKGNHNNLIEKSLRLKHKRINKLMEARPEISMLQITKIVEDCMDLEYQELLTTVYSKYPSKTF